MPKYKILIGFDIIMSVFLFIRITYGIIKSLLKMNIRLKITFYLLIIVAFIAPPFVFSEIDFGREMRLLLGIIIMILLFFESTKFQIKDFILILLLGIIILIEVMFQKSSINNILSSYAVILISLLLFRVLKLNKLNSEFFLNLWSSFTLLISISAIISFVIHQFSSFNADFLNFSSSFLYTPEYNYRMSIFGFTMIKDYSFVTIARVCSFFTEPQYAGIFFSFNMLLIKNRFKIIPIKYFVANLLAGLLTFSITFYLAFFILTIFSMKVKHIRTMLFCFLIIFVYFVFISDVDINRLLKFTSYSDRIDRNTYAINYLIYKAPLSNILFGHGINNYQLINEDELGRGLSAGFLYLLFENGFFFTCFIIFLLASFTNNNWMIILIALFYMLAIPWHKYYFCWYAIILCGLNHVNSFHYKNTDNKNSFLN